ncbi:MAG: ComF family protein [Comamonadaceae bacterium CG_4_9_14_3_um_filter_60_33]|nr:MAG: phosphoribosyltransferase [Comamonadaceae bacterium CG2_30_59_20]PIY29740.1 MAG: ComF family protein [Comamonadaceae bacterium CG_4_10_14_3_um_filter_60_42]PJB44890.1 MAG: ComF family protein [Comamonadaceae bacterium CG_4_9_14_3_um_filter_60_33]
MFTSLFSGMLHPPASQCRVCHSWPAQPVCDPCVAEFAQPLHRCRTCALPLPAGLAQCGTCLKEAPPLDLCLAAVPYAFPWAQLMADFKFHDQPALVRFFADLLKATPWVEHALDAADLLLPMPLSRQRLQTRGYNQALLLAQRLNPGKSRAAVLLRIADTPAQHTLKRAARLTSLDHAFAVDPLKAPLLQGARLVLVDDVMTTGTSLYTAARVLKAAGAAHITGLVIARTE